MVVEAFVRKVKPTIKDSMDNHKKREDNNDSSVIVETVIQEKEIRPLHSDHIIMFPNTALLDEHAQKQKLTGIIDSHDLTNNTKDQDLLKAQINMTYQLPFIKAINGLRKELKLPLVSEREVIPEFANFAVGLALPMQHDIQECLTLDRSRKAIMMMLSHVK